MHFPQGFGIPLLDFAAFVFFAYLADSYTWPARGYRWFFALLFAAIAILFFICWIRDLGAHVG
jgi:hypothetical protein